VGGQAKYDEFVSAGKAKNDERIAEAEALVAEAQQKRSELLKELGSERSVLQKEIEELRTFERSHCAHLKSYLEGQLIELEQTGGPRLADSESRQALAARERPDVTALATTAVFANGAQMTLQLACTPLRSDTGSLSGESTEPLTVESVQGCRSPWLAEGAQLRWWGEASDRWSSSCPSGMPRTRTGSGAVPAGTSRTTIALDVGQLLPRAVESNGTSGLVSG
jgi:hypothetical protein